MYCSWPPLASTAASSPYPCRHFEVMPPASVAWFPFNEDASSSWPPKITFSSSDPASARAKVPRSSRIPPPDEMESVKAQRPRSSSRSDYSRSVTRPIPNRSSRSNRQSVPTTPSSLWRQIPPLAECKQDTSFACSLSGSHRCVHPPVGSGRVRAIPSSMDLELDARSCPESRSVRGVRDAGESRPSPRVSLPRPSPLPNVAPVIQVERSVKEDDYRQLWSAQKEKHPRLPLVVSHLNPLRARMPASYQESVASGSCKVEWNFKKTSRNGLPLRQDCDAAADRLSSRAIFLGKARAHCRACKEDTLLKRLLRFNYWIAYKDYMFEQAALGLDCWEMHDAAAAGDHSDNFPQSVSLRDREDFDCEDDDVDHMDDAPLIDIIQRHPRYADPLF